MAGSNELGINYNADWALSYSLEYFTSGSASDDLTAKSEPASVEPKVGTQAQL